MSYKSGFFDAVDLGEGVYDRVYSAADFAEYFSRFVGNGVFISQANGLTVQSSGGMSISIRPGYAWINGYLFSVISGTTETLTVPVANPTMNRYDSVVLGLNYQDRQITPYIKSGTPASTPYPVALTRSSSLYEIEIARVYVATGASYVSQANITDTRANKARCGFVTGLINQIDSTGLFEQFQAAFNQWFQDLQDTLDDDVAANLLARIQAAEQDISDLSSEVSRAKQDISSLSGEVHNAEQDISALSSEVNRAEQNISDLSSEVDSIHSTVASHTTTLATVSRLYSSSYKGAGSTSKSIQFPFSPRRVTITCISSATVSGATTYVKDTIDILTSNGASYKGVFTRQSSDNVQIVYRVNVSKSVSGSSTTLTWSSSNSTRACNESGETYYVTAWGL